MKKIVYLIVFLTSFVIILFSSCELPTTSFNEDFLIGKWERPSIKTDGKDCYRYDANYAGVAWDTGDDVSEAEAQPFSWSVEGATLTQIHEGEMGQAVPKVYTLLTLNDSTLRYRDDYGNSSTFIKIK